MEFLVSLLALFWPFYQFSQVPFLSSSGFVRIYLIDFLVFLIFINQVFKFLAQKKKTKKQLQKHPLAKPIALFLLIALVSLLTAKLVNPLLDWSKIAISSLYLLRFIVYSSLLFIPFSRQNKSLFQFSFFLVPLVGLIQYLVLPDLRFLKGIGFDDHYFRLSFPFLDPNYTGVVCAFLLLLNLKDIKKRKFQILSLLSFFSLALTFSRASYLSFFAGLVFLSFKKPIIKKITLITIPLFILTIILIPKPFGEGVNLKRTFSISSRMINLKENFNLFSKNPITGIGFNTLSHQKQYDPTLINRASAGTDNSLLFVLVTTGLLGFVAFTKLIISVFKYAPNLYLQSAMFALLVHSLFNNTLFYTPILILVFLSLNSSANT